MYKISIFNLIEVWQIQSRTKNEYVTQSKEHVIESMQKSDNEKKLVNKNAKFCVWSWWMILDIGETMQNNKQAIKNWKNKIK